MIRLNKPPCKERQDSPDCPNRAVGCQATCEKYRAFRAERDRLLDENRKKDLIWDYTAHSIYRRRAMLKCTQDGRKVLSEW